MAFEFRKILSATMERCKRNCVLILAICLWVMPAVRGCVEDYTTSSHHANCSNTNVEHVPFSLHHDIRILDLSNNNIHELQENAFFKYNNLQRLYLRNNSLAVIRENAFARLVNLQHLNLSGNSLTSVPSIAFSDLPSLLFLSLRGNRISVVRKKAFFTLTKLNHLYLDGNHIRFIHPSAFSGLRHLQWLELQNNALRDLDPSVMRYFTMGFLGIKLHKNPWFCDCKMRWLPQWLSEDKVHQKLQWTFGMEEPKCQGPTLVKDKGFSTLAGELFVCNVEMYSSGHNKILEPEENVNLFCKYYSDPPADAVWKKDEEPIDLISEDSLKKYQVNSTGTNMRTTTLHISEFQLEDIGTYQCFVENLRSSDSNTFVVTLAGVDPSAVTLTLKERDNHESSVQSAIIAGSVIGGFIVLLLVIVGIIFGVIRCRRIRKIRRETIRLTFQEHLKANGIIESSPKDEKMYDDIRDCRPPLEITEHNPLYDSRVGPESTAAPGANTYISFKSELSEPEDISQYYPSVNEVPEEYSHYYSPDDLRDYEDPPVEYVQYYPTVRRTSHGDECDDYTQFYPSISRTNHCEGAEDYTQYYPSVRTNRSDGSQCESTSPLLEHISPIMLDSNEPVYESQIYVPRSVPRSHTLHPHYLYSHHRYTHYPDGDYSTLSQGPHYVTPNMRLPENAPHKSASVGNLEQIPPKKPPRLFHSRDSMSSALGENGTKLSLPKPGSVDQYGTAV